MMLSVCYMVVTFALAVVGMVVTTFSVALAAEAPVKEVVVSHFGWDVNGTKEREAGASQAEKNICTVVSGDECKPGKQSSAPGGFNGAQGVGVTHGGEVDVADFRNDRVQRFGADGAFTGMFGMSGGEAGQMSKPHSIAVDSATNSNVFVQDLLNWRIDEFTPTGVFVLMIGKEVNETKALIVQAKGGVPTGKEVEEVNLCTEQEIETEGVKCKPGVQNTSESMEPGAFNFVSGVYGNVIAVGGPEGLLYVGDEHRVQEFNVDGKFVREIREPLERISPASESRATALTIDNNRDVFLTYSVNFTDNVIREFDSSGKEIHAFIVTPVHPETFNDVVEVVGMSFDDAGRLAVLEGERYETPMVTHAARGALNEVVEEVGVTNLHLVTTFANEPALEGGTSGLSSSAVSFSETDDMYAATGENEVIIYTPKSVAGLLNLPTTCMTGIDHGTNATIDCTLSGEVNPYSVPETRAWFDWGKTCSVGTETASRDVATTEKVSASLDGLRPDETYCEDLAAYDQNVHLPESALTSIKESFKTEPLPPRVVGTPSTEFVGSSSAAMLAKLNPENAPTEYFFEYGPCGEVPHQFRTRALTSSAYGTIEAILEATRLQPATTYCYALAATNNAQQTASEKREGKFTTASLPVPMAVTGPATAITATSALVSGSINPDGQPATYTFELGIDQGAETQYGIVFSGPVAESVVPVEESLGLTGLQPGVAYAYRISVKSGYGESTGDSGIFTTAGIASVLSQQPVIPQLAIPKIIFPKAATLVKRLTNGQKLANALKACEKRPKRERPGCKRSARKKYEVSGKKKAEGKKKK